MAAKKDRGLIYAIVFASVVMAGSIIFFATQLVGSRMNDDELQTRVEKGIEKYVADQQQKQEQQQADMAVSQIKSTASEAKRVPPVNEKDHVYGQQDARFSIIEYSDFQCAYCTRFHSTAKQIVDSSNGQVNWIYRHFPLSFHEPVATKQAVASECVAELAGNDGFWSFTNAVFEQGISDDDSMLQLAKNVGADEDKYKSCVQSGRHDQRIKTDIADATDIGVTGTPGNILLDSQTGKAVRIDGAQKPQIFQKFIDDPSNFES